MGRLSALLILVAACGFNPPDLVPGDDDPGRDGGMEAGDPNCEIWLPRGGHVNPCSGHYPAGGAWEVQGEVTFDTQEGEVSGGARPMSSEIAQIDNYRARVVTVESFTIPSGSKLRVTGPVPLIILSWTTIEIAGELDASSRRAGTPEVGPGGLRQGCTTAGDGEGDSNSGGGGGGGFGTGGGDGGNGDDSGENNEGGDGAGSTAGPTIVVGGCRGGNGGMNDATAGDGGAAGGAIQLIAKDSIVVSGQVHAGGQGGQGGQGSGGGGGGGSGGYIGLDAPMVTAMTGSILAANGGGGGTGCEGMNGPNGEDGQVSEERAAGGPAADCDTPRQGGRGGAGMGAMSSGENGANSAGSGGGGGGGVGYIFVWADRRALQGTASPRTVNR